MEKLNIYFVVTHPIQYFAPLYQHLAEKENVNVKVFFCSDETIHGVKDQQFGVNFRWDIPLLTGYEHKFLRNWSWKPSIFKGFWGLINPGIILELFKMPKGMVVINGWHSCSYILSYLAAKLFGHQIAMHCDTPVYLETNRKGFKNAIRRFLIGKILLSHFVDKGLYIGHQNKLFYQYYKVNADKLVFTPFSIDNNRFREGMSNFNRIEERAKLSIGEKDFVVLYTGKFIAIKRPLDIIKAFHLLQVPVKHLVLVGDGDLKESMMKYIEDHGIGNIHFAGFINQKELPKYYGLSDVLVMCSETEPWGLSINEGMACGLPVVVSDKVGCAEDLIAEGGNGFVFSKGNIESFAESIQAIFQEKITTNMMGVVSKEIIEKYSIEKTADGVVNACLAIKKRLR